MKTLFLLLSFLFLVACNRPDPNPELKDPIFREIEGKIKESEAALASEKKTLEEAEGEIKKAIPQTGQIKFARKRLFEVKSRIEKLEQSLRYYQIRKESRINEAREAYLAAFDKGETWPNPEEFETYQVSEAARTKSRNWSVKKRMAEEGVTIKDPTSAPATEKPASGGGGGH